MRTKNNDQRIISKADFDVLHHYLGANSEVACPLHVSELICGLGYATLIDDRHFPVDVVRLNSRTTIKEPATKLKYTYTVVMPQHADHKKCRVSIVSVLGASLIGRRVGEVIAWQTGNLNRLFMIVSVSAFPVKIA
jgi:transcription elongation GreA/GreB family factor